MRDSDIARRRLLGIVAASLCCDAGESRSAPRRKPARHVVAIDPGHGGADPGAISPGGVYEKNITLDTALALARRLNASPSLSAVLTRRSDVYVPLLHRVARARAAHAELFVSIHADKLPNPELHGLSVYTLSEAASDRETAELAARENKDASVAGLNLSHRPRMVGGILLDLMRRGTNNRSLVLAREVAEEMGRVVSLLETPRRSAGFAVLSAPDIPSVLIELGCLSNHDEERLLMAGAYRGRLAAGLMRAIEGYFAVSGGTA